MFNKLLCAFIGIALMASASVHAALPAGVSSAVTDMNFDVATLAGLILVLVVLLTSITVSVNLIKSSSGSHFYHDPLFQDHDPKQLDDMINEHNSRNNR